MNLFGQEVKKRTVIGTVIVAMVLILMICVPAGLFGGNDTQNWQVIQYPNGTIEIRDDAGVYMKWFARVWTYPRVYQAYFSQSNEEGGMKDQSVRVTFNDASEAQISSLVRFRTPIEQDRRLAFHRTFSGSMENAVHAVRAYMINILKATAPLMSASENQSARKGEFRQLVYDQMQEGMFRMRQVEKRLKDRFDETGKPITVWATEVIIDEETGTPVISSESVLKVYGINVEDFSVTETEYDPKTKELFAAKKESFLKAERSKAEREEQVQERLMIVERGKKELAEVEADTNKAKKKAVIEAQLKAEVAEQKKVEEETKAAMLLAVAEVKKNEEETKAKMIMEVAKLEAEKLLEVAKVKKIEEETRATMSLEVAKLRSQAAIKEGEAIITLAKAKEQEIALAGAMTEKERVVLEIAAERDARVAEKLAQIHVPTVVITGGENGGSQASTMQNLINMWLLRQTGVLKDNPVTPK